MRLAAVLHFCRQGGAYTTLDSPAINHALDASLHTQGLPDFFRKKRSQGLASDSTRQRGLLN